MLLGRLDGAGDGAVDRLQRRDGLGVVAVVDGVGRVLASPDRRA
jgi:hypothetical protein